MRNLLKLTFTYFSIIFSGSLVSREISNVLDRMNFISDSGNGLKRRKVPALFNPLFWITSVNVDEEDLLL